MRHILWLALQYLHYHWARSLLLVIVSAIVLLVPLATQILLSSSERTLTARAEATPLVLGKSGSALDLTMAALYFADDQPSPVTMAEVDAIWDSGYATPIPLYLPFSTQGFRIVGTSLDYFEFRGLQITEGRGLAVLGEAVIGAKVAAALNKSVGDTLISTPANLFDLDGTYPLEMTIVGILSPTSSADDSAVFTDIKTSWVIAGIGHGHDDVVTLDEDGQARASAAIVQFQRITKDNIESFHFHGDASSYPVSAVLVDPYDERGATILRGRHTAANSPTQLIRPKGVIAKLVDRIFQVKRLFDIVALMIGLAALLAIGLAVFLTYRLRAREIETAYKIGAQRGMIAQLLVAETVILLSISMAIVAVIIGLVLNNADAFLAFLLSLHP